MRLSLILLFLFVATTSAFQVYRSPASRCHSTASAGASYCPLTPHNTASVSVPSRQSTSQLYALSPDILPIIFLAGAAAAAFQEYRTDEFKAVKDFIGPTLDKIEDEMEDIEHQIEEIKEDIEEKAEIVEKKTEKKTEIPPKTVTTVEDGVLVKKKEEPKKRESKPLNELVKEVGKTVEQNREMEERVKERRKMSTTMPAVPAERATSIVSKKRAVTPLRVAKKILAPWRKWDNIE